MLQIFIFSFIYRKWMRNDFLTLGYPIDCPSWIVKCPVAGLTGVRLDDTGIFQLFSANICEVMCCFWLMYTSWNLRISFCCKMMQESYDWLLSLCKTTGLRFSVFWKRLWDKLRKFFGRQSEQAAVLCKIQCLFLLWLNVSFALAICKTW